MGTVYRTTCAGCDERGQRLQEAQEDIRKLRAQRRGVLAGSFGRVLLIVLMIGVLVLGAAAIGGQVYGMAKRPVTPEACVESAELLGYNNSSRKCPEGARMDTRPVGGAESQMVLVRCLCLEDWEKADRGVQRPEREMQAEHP